MFAIIRRYDGVDQNRSAELTRKVNEMLVPKLEKLKFAGYWLIESGNGVFSSPGPFETPEQGMESTKFVATWLRDEKPRHDRPQRAEDHERQGRRSQRPRPGRRVSSTAPHPDEKGPGLPGPFRDRSSADDAGRPWEFARVKLENAIGAPAAGTPGTRGGSPGRSGCPARGAGPHGTGAVRS